MSLLRKRQVLYSCLALVLTLGYAASHYGKLETDILECIRLNDLESLRSLLQSHPDEVHARNKDGNTPLHWAALWDHHEIVQILLANKAAVNAKNKAGKTPLHWAATCGNLAVADVLLAHGASIRERDHWGQTPFHCVFVVGTQFMPNLQIAERLLEQGADINRLDLHGRTPLHWAALMDHPEAVRFLLARGAEMDIFAASALGELAKVAQLINGQPGLACATNVAGVTPLHWAASEGRVEVAALLLASGADINARDRDETTPLHGASAPNGTAMTQLLIAHYANVDAKDKHGQTAIHYAVERGRDDLAEMLYAHVSEK